MSTASPQRNFKRVTTGGGGNWLKPKKWEDWTPGDYVEGEFVQAKELDKYKKPIYEIRVQTKKITGNDPTILVGERAGIMPLYPNGGLMMQMEKASPGDIVRITYQGMATVTNKKSTYYGEPCHNVTVEIDGYEDAEVEVDGNDLLG